MTHTLAVFTLLCSTAIMCARSASCGDGYCEASEINYCVADCACDAGYTRNQATLECSLCAIGAYVPKGSIGSCSTYNCKPGTTDEDNDPATPCANCPNGTYSTGGFHGQCIACAAGTFDHDQDPSTPCVRGGVCIESSPTPNWAFTASKVIANETALSADQCSSICCSKANCEKWTFSWSNKWCALMEGSEDAGTLMTGYVSGTVAINHMLEEMQSSSSATSKPVLSSLESDSIGGCADILAWCYITYRPLGDCTQAARYVCCLDECLTGNVDGCVADLSIEGKCAEPLCQAQANKSMSLCPVNQSSSISKTSSAYPSSVVDSSMSDGEASRAGGIFVLAIALINLGLP